MFRPPFGESPCAASSSHCGGTRTLLREARDADSVMPNICWNGDAKATLNSNDFTKMIHENGFTSDSNSTIQNRITRISSISSGTSNTLLKKALTNCINTQQQQEKQQQQKQQKQQQQQQQQQQIIHISKIPIRQSRLKDNNSSDNFNYNSLRAKTVLLREYPRVRADENKVIIRDYEIPPDPKPFIQDKLLDTSEGIVECLSSMSTSLLTNAAWYRDANGCTGFLPTEWRSLPNVQNSAIKTKLNADLADKYENKGRRDTMSDILWKNTKFTEHDKQNYQQNVAELKRYKSALRNTINIDKSIPRPFDDGAESGASSASEISRHSQKSVTFSEKVTEIHSSMIDSNIRTTAEEEPKTNKNENDLSFSTSFNVKNKANTEMLVDNELETLLNTLKICDEKTKCRVNEDNSMKKPSNNETSEQISEDKEKMAAVPPRLPPRSPKNILTIKKSKSTRSVSPQKSQKIVRSASGYLEEDHSVVLNNDNPLSNNVTNTSFLTESYLKRPNKLDTSKRRLSRSLQDPQMSYYDNVTPVYQTNSSNQFPTAEKKNKNSSSENDGDGLSVHEINAPNSSGKFRKSFLTKHDRNKLHKESREKKMFTNNKINNKAAVLLRHVVAGEAVDVQRRDSMLDSDSHESIVSATSLRAESRVRRFFDY